MVISKMAAKMAQKLAYLLNYLHEGVYHWVSDQSSSIDDVI